MQRATDAKTETEKGQEKEIVALAYNSALAKKVDNGNSTEVTAEDLNIELTNQGANATGSDPIKVTFTASKRQYTININGEIAYAGINDYKEIASTSETTPWLPTGATITNNNLENGLTIKDANGNEWVWIVVPKSITIDATENTQIEQALLNYTKTDKDGNNFIDRSGNSDTYYAGKGLSESEFNAKKNVMLQSIKQNGGFYIGKYETGTQIARTNKNDELTTAKIKQNVYPYNYVTNEQAENIAEELATGGKNCTLLFGLQWDLVLRYLNESGVNSNDLISDSTNIGNYANSEFTLNNGKYNNYDKDNWILTNWKDYTIKTPGFVDENHKKLKNDENDEWDIYAEGCLLLTTGASDKNCKQNIYDLAGNVSEWTLEYTSQSNIPCNCRGGCCTEMGSALSCAVGGYGSSTKENTSTESIGFRATLY